MSNRKQREVGIGRPRKAVFGKCDLKVVLKAYIASEGDICVAQVHMCCMSAD
jgi:hypothetical protein